MTQFLVISFTIYMRKSILILLHANILKFIDGHWSRGCCGLPFEAGNTVRRINSSVPIRLAQCLLINSSRGVGLFIKYLSSVSLSLSFFLLLPEISIQRNSNQNVVLTDATLFSRCIGATMSYNEVHLRHCESRRAPDITCTLLDELRTMLLMEIYIPDRSET